METKDGTTIHCGLTHCKNEATSMWAHYTRWETGKLNGRQMESHFPLCPKHNTMLKEDSRKAYSIVTQLFESTRDEDQPDFEDLDLEELLQKA